MKARWCAALVSLTVLLSLTPPVWSADQESGDAQPALGRIQAIREEQRARLAEAKQSAKESPGPSESALTAGRMAKGLGFCVGVFLIGFGLMKRFRRTPKRGPGKRISIIERVPLTQKSCLVLARVDGRDVLIGVGSENVSVTELQLDGTLDEQGEVNLEMLRAIEHGRPAANGA